MSLSEFPIRLKTIRKQRQLTLVQLADLTGISPSHLSALERGARMPSLHYAQKIARGLEIPLSELYLEYDLKSSQSENRELWSADYETSDHSERILESYRSYQFPEDWRTRLLMASHEETEPYLQLAWTFLQLHREQQPLSLWVQVFAEFIQLQERRMRSKKG